MAGVEREHSEPIGGVVAKSSARAYARLAVGSGAEANEGDDAMCEGKRIIEIAGLATAVLLSAMMFATVLPCGASAQQAAATSPKVHELATALAQEWLTEQGVAKSAPAPPAQEADGSVDDVSSRIGAIHDQIMALAGAIPNLPNEFRRAVARVTAIDPDAGRGQVFLDLSIFGTRTWSRTDASLPRPRLSSTSPFWGWSALALNGCSGG